MPLVRLVAVVSDLNYHFERGKPLDDIGVNRPYLRARPETEIEGDFGPIRRPGGHGERARRHVAGQAGLNVENDARHGVVAVPSAKAELAAVGRPSAQQADSLRQDESLREFRIVHLLNDQVGAVLVGHALPVRRNGRISIRHCGPHAWRRELAVSQDFGGHQLVPIEGLEEQRLAIGRPGGHAAGRNANRLALGNFGRPDGLCRSRSGDVGDPPPVLSRPGRIFSGSRKGSRLFRGHVVDLYSVIVAAATEDDLLAVRRPTRSLPLNQEFAVHLADAPGRRRNGKRHGKRRRLTRNRRY